MTEVQPAPRFESALVVRRGGQLRVGPTRRSPEATARSLPQAMFRISRAPVLAISLSLRHVHSERRDRGAEPQRAGPERCPLRSCPRRARAHPYAQRADAQRARGEPCCPCPGRPAARPVPVDPSQRYRARPCVASAAISNAPPPAASPVSRKGHRCVLLDEWVISLTEDHADGPPTGGPLRLPQTPPLGGTLPRMQRPRLGPLPAVAPRAARPTSCT